MFSESIIRPASLVDAEAIASIYNAEGSAGTSNYSSHPQSVDERTTWLEQLNHKNYPVLVAEDSGTVVGFAALTPFHSLEGYRFTVTGSIYIVSTHRRKGVGRSLLVALEIEARKRNYHCVVAGVNSENSASLTLLKAFGFKHVGFFPQIGFKNGEWFDDVCLQKILTQGAM